jgi:hypothetical protein
MFCDCACDVQMKEDKLKKNLELLSFIFVKFRL